MTVAEDALPLILAIECFFYRCLHGVIEESNPREPAALPDKTEATLPPPRYPPPLAFSLGEKQV